MLYGIDNLLRHACRLDLNTGGAVVMGHIKPVGRFDVITWPNPGALVFVPALGCAGVAVLGSCGVVRRRRSVDRG